MENILCDRQAVLLARYAQHAEHLRELDGWDLKVTTGFMTIQIVLAGWLYAHPAQQLMPLLLVILINFLLLIGAIGGLYSSSRRRIEIRGTIWNINEALGLYAVGTYLPDRAVDSKRPRSRWERWLRWYDFVCIAGFIGVTVMLLVNRSASPPPYLC
jgi:hypothetical protein